MSFILDALKRSETERRQAAESDSGSGGSAPVASRSRARRAMLVALLVPGLAVAGWWAYTEFGPIGADGAAADAARVADQPEKERGAGKARADQPRAQQPAAQEVVTSDAQQAAPTVDRPAAPAPKLTKEERKAQRKAQRQAEREARVAAEKQSRRAAARAAKAESGSAAAEQPIAINEPPAVEPQASNALVEVTQVEPEPVAAVDLNDRTPARERPGRPEPAQTQEPSQTRPSFRLPHELPLAMRLALPELALNMHVYHSDPSRRFVLLNMQRLEEGETIEQDEKSLKVHRIEPNGVVLEFKGQHFLLPNT